MGFFDFLNASDDDQPAKAALQQLGKRGKETDESNPLLVFIKALFSLIKEALFPGGNKDAPDFEDGTPAERAAARRQYESSRRSEEEKLPSYSASVRSRLSPEFVREEPEKLLELRRHIEQQNGGHRIQAIMPVADGVRITEGFGHREAPTKGASTEHKGLDIAPARPGDTPDIIAPMPGRVEFAGVKEGYGNKVDMIDIYGTRHRFGHLKEITIHAGEEVAQGQKIAVMGATGRATGVHLHYEQRDANGNAKDPLLLARNWNEGDKLSRGENLAFLETQNRATLLAGNAGNRAQQQAASLSMGGHIVADGTYVPPVPVASAGSQQDKHAKG